MCARKIFSNLHSYPPKYQMVHPLLQRHCRLMFAYLSKCYTSIFCDISETLKDGQVRTSKHCPSFLSFFIEIKDSSLKMISECKMYEKYRFCSTLNKILPKTYFLEFGLIWIHRCVPYKDA